jgi:hypothetical protein
MESLSPCFSSREAALAECLLLCFFTSEEKITALLIIADSPYLFLEASILRLFFAAVTALASPILARARGSRLRKRRDHGLLRNDRFLASLRKYAGDLPQGSSLTVFTLDVKALVKEILGANPDIDSYRVFQDMSSVIETLLAGCPVFVSSAKKKILAVTQAGKYDSALFIHQVSLRLGKLFQNAGGGEAREYSGITITENLLPDREIPDDIVARFI